jgi:hypothetical protein
MIDNAVHHNYTIDDNHQYISTMDLDENQFLYLIIQLDNDVYHQVL